MPLCDALQQRVTAIKYDTVKANERRRQVVFALSHQSSARSAVWKAGFGC
jgi:hypothetical protein